MPAIPSIPADGLSDRVSSNFAIRWTIRHTSRRSIGEGGVLRFWRSWRHNGAMPSVQIKDVPEGTHAVLRQRAAAAHQSLQEYLLAKLVEEASRPTVDEVLARAGGRAGGSVPLKSASRILRAERARR